MIDRQRLELLLEDNRRGHSDFQLDRFITMRSGAYTPWGMYLQAVRELETRWDNVRGTYLFLEEEALRIELLRASVPFFPLTRKQRIRRRIAQLAVEQAELGLEGRKQNLPDLEREMLRFFAQADALRDHLPDDLTYAVKARLDEDLWYTKIKATLAADFIRTGCPGVGFYEFLPSLPRRIREQLMVDEKNPGATVEWLRHLNSHENTIEQSPAEGSPLLDIDLKELVG